jgi:polyribonucleotide 5'-hydroxyl-kinase
METGPAGGKVTHTLQANEEFRFEVDSASVVELTLAAGAAEVFGTEMVSNRAYKFCGTQQAVFTWSGCTLEVVGQCGHSYIAQETPMASYLQLHGELNDRRTAARATGSEGPRVLIAGPVDTGKSSLCRLLANYLVRSGHAGTLVDLDVEQGELLVPGTVVALPLAQPLEIERGTEDLQPLAHWIGHAVASEHVQLMRLHCSSLANAVRQRNAADSASRAGGVIINSSGWVDGAGYELLLHQANEFKVDVLVVIGDDRLHSQLTAHAAQSALRPTVVKLSKSGGVITRSPMAREKAWRARIHEYFYGVRAELHPHSSVYDFSACQVFSITNAPQAPSTALPIGMKVPDDQMVAHQLPVSRYPSLMYSVLAVMMSDSGQCDDLLRANVAGFVWVTQVDMERQKVTVLTPSPVALPSCWLLAGSVKWAQED